MCWRVYSTPRATRSNVVRVRANPHPHLNPHPHPNPNPNQGEQPLERPAVLWFRLAAAAALGATAALLLTRVRLKG